MLSNLRTNLVFQLKTYRLKMGLTQDDIAWKLGFSVQTVSRWERGISVPDLRAVGAMVDFLRRADEQTARLLFSSVRNSSESCNIWEGLDARYLAGSRREFAETPQMAGLIGVKLRPYLVGAYDNFMSDPALVAALKAGELASVDVYGRTALAMTSIPEGFVQKKRMTFQSELRDVIRCRTDSYLIPEAEAPMKTGLVMTTWDELLDGG